MARSSKEDSNFVALAQRVCAVCGKHYDTNESLPHSKLPDVPEDVCALGYGIGHEHQKLKDNGFIALVECDPNKTPIAKDEMIKPSDAYRTGRIIHVKATAWHLLFNIAPPPKGIAFIAPDTFAILEKRQQEAEGTDDAPRNNVGRRRGMDQEPL
jgi:hypothetical protein